VITPRLKEIMTNDLFLALVVFAAIAAYTPGPNNTILMASGINYGFRQTLPMIFGVGLGFPLMIACVGLGLGKIFEIFPQIYTALKYLGAAYMLWLAYKIANSKPSSGENDSAAKPLTFLQGAAFQWINPKGWIMAVTALSAYTLASDYYFGVVAVVATFMFMGFTSAATWAMFGVILKEVMGSPKWFKLINYGLAALLVLSLVPLLLH
jgi:threonine/homoserine/homoserine lactone efflux protein